MEDKLELLYNSYIENGLLSPKTTFEQFSNADKSIIENLYNEGVRKRIVSSKTDYQTFESAWGTSKKKEETLAPTGSDLEASGQPATGTPASESDLTSQPSEPSELPYQQDGSSFMPESQEQQSELKYGGVYLGEYLSDPSDYKPMINRFPAYGQSDLKTREFERIKLPFRAYTDDDPKLPQYKGSGDPNQVVKADQSYSDITLMMAENLGMSPEDYMDTGKRLKREEEIRDEQKAIDNIKKKKIQNDIEKTYVETISKVYDMSEEDARENLANLALYNLYFDPEGTGLKLDPIEGMEDFDIDDVLEFRASLANKAIEKGGDELIKKVFVNMVDKKGGDVEAAKIEFEKGMERIGEMFLSDDLKKVRDLRKSIIELENTPIQSEASKEMLRIKRLELKKFTDQGNYGANTLFDPKTGQYVSGNTKDPEIISFNKEMNKKVKTYENTDVGRLKKRRDDLYFQYQNFVNNVMLDQDIANLNSIAREKYANLFGLTTPTDSQGLNAEFTKDQKKQIAIDMYGNPYNFHGWDLGGKGDMSDAFKIMNSDIFGYEVTMKAQLILADFMAVNRALKLNEDPAGIEDSKGFERFFTYAGKGFKEEMGGVSQVDEVVAERTINQIKSLGYEIPLSQMESLKKDFTQELGEAAGASIPVMGEIMMDLALVNKVAGVAKIPKLIETLSRGNKVAKFGLDLIYEAASQGAAFEMAGEGFVGGAGEGVGQFLVDAALKKFKVNNRMLSILSKSVGGALSQTAAEYTGQFVDELSKNNVGFDKAVERTFGKTPEDAMEKFALTYLLSQIYGTGTSTVSTFTNPLNRGVDTEEQVSNEEWADWASKQVINFESDSPIVNEIKKFAEEQQSQLSPVQKTEIESIIEQQKQGPQKADIERIRQEELSILDAKQAESEKTGEIPTDENGNAINIKEEKQKINSKYDAALAVQEQDNINQQKQTTDEVQESQEGDVSTEEEVQKQDVEPTEEGKQEIINPSQVNPSEITQRNKEAEARLKKEGVDNLFIGANLPTGSNEKALPVSVDVINDIAVATYANEKTGLINTVISGFSENNFVGYYRIYENGKPTNKWSSKFENQNTGDKNIDSKKKDNFKTMISSVQERLPSDHLYTEKTSISTDGLRVWGNQIDRGTYEFALDEKGFYITNRVSINGDALVNELGIDVKQGDFQNIKVRTEKEFNKVKEALLPYLEKLRLNENNIYWTKPKGAARLAGSTVEIDLPVLKPVQTEVKPKVTTEEVASYTAKDIAESTDAKAFAEAQSSALSQRTDTKLQVDPTSEQDAQKIIDEGGKLFLTSDGKAGAYVTADGYMGGLFKDPNSDKNQASKALQEVRTKAGGKFFDAFGINPETGDGTTLEEIYVKNGFRPVARMPFDPDMAPKGWENTTLASKPDNVFFVYDPDYKAKVGEGETITDFDKAYEMAKNYKPTSTSNSANKTVVEPGKRLFNEPNKETAQISKKYREEKGIEFDEGEPITELDEDLSKEIADAYEAMEDNPNDPEVKEAYDALALETVDQYKALMDAGYEVEIYKGEGEPYANSEEMIKDLKENKHIYIFSTEGGFGETGITDKQRSENAMLGSTEFKDVNGEPLLVNDLFRAVHDFFGHSERGNGFGAIGEENAWDVHARMFSDKARRAMTTETKGQNSWVNFGPQMRGKDGKILKKGDKGYLKPSERKFAEQKMGLLPEKYSEISSTKKEPTVSTEETFEVADDVIPEVTEGALSLLDAFGKKPKKSKVTPKKRKQVLDQVAKAEKALSKISPKTKIVVHETSKDYTESGRNRNQNEGGEYDIDTDTIHINMEAANERTVAHEVFHTLLLSKGMGDKQAQAITNKMLDAVKKSASPELLAELEEFSSRYEQPLQSEESIAELFGILASEYETLPRPTQNLIKRWLDKLAKLFGLKLFTDNEVVDMLNTVSKSVREGSVIEESDIDVIRRDPMPARDTRADFLGGIPIDELTDADLDQNQTRQWDREQKPLRRLQSNFSDAVSKLTFSYDKNSDRFDKLKKEGYITDGKSISDFDGKFFFFHQPDAAFSGQILKDGELLVEGKGGMYYPIKFHEDGYFWASTDRVAKKMADDLNKVMEQNGGKIYMALTSAPRSKLMSSTTMSNAVMDFFSSKSFDSNFNISEAQVKRSIVRAANNVKTVNGKKVGLNMSLSVKDSLSEIKSSVSEKLDPKKSSFKDRKSFVEDLVGEMSREINKKDISIEQFGKFFSEGIQNKYFKGVTKTGKVKVSKANMIQALSEMMTEPILKDDISRESGGQIYAVLEMEGKVKPVKSDKHESYPMAIQSAEDKKTTLHILSDRVDWGDVTEDFETNEIVKPERRKKIYPTSGVSTRGLKINTKSVRRRKQKPSDDRPSIEAVREKAKQLGISEKDTEIALRNMGYTNAEIKADKNKSDPFEEEMRGLRKDLGKKEKKSPSVKKILGEPKDKKVTMTERSALKSQIRMEARAARDSKKDQDKRRSAISSMVSDIISRMRNDAKVKSRKLNAIQKKINRTNLNNPVMVERLIRYINNVMEDVNYSAKLAEANKNRSAMKRMTKSKKRAANLRASADEFALIDPSMVSDIDEYLNRSREIVAGLSPTSISPNKIKVSDKFDSSDMDSYINSQLKSQRSKMREALNEHFEEVTGISGEGMEISEMIKAIEESKDTGATPEMLEPITKANVKKAYDSYSSLVSEMANTNSDPFTGESLELSDSEIDLAKRLANLDVLSMSKEEAVKAVDAMSNFLVNQSLAGAESIVSKAEGNSAALKLVNKGIKSRPLKLYFSKRIGRTMAEQFTTLPIVLERMFGKSKARLIQKVSGLSDVISGYATAKQKSSRIIKSYTDKFSKKKPNGEVFNSSTNINERGLVSFMSRSIEGNEQAEFDRRKNLIKESIDALKRGTEADVKRGENYQEVYDKLLKDSNNIAEVRSKADKTNLEAVDWWVNEWSKHYDDLRKTNLEVYNELLDKDLNYTPDIYKKIDLSEDVDMNKSSFFNANNYLDKSKSGSLREVTRPNSLPKNSRGEASRYISLDFDMNNANIIQSALTDINTASPIMKLEGFLNSNGMNSIVSSKEDRDFIERRIKNYVRNVKGSNFSDRSELDNISKGLEFLAALGVSKALGGITQSVKQSVPVAVNTIINSGRLDLASMFDPDTKAFIENSGMPIANRGIASQASLDHINRLIEQVSDSKGKEALKKLEDLNRLYLKVFLQNADVFIARASFISYYKQGLKKQGINPKDIDFSNHKPNKDALDFAQQQVDRQQNVSDEYLQGEFFTGKDVLRKTIRKVAMPFANFAMNQKARMNSDIITLTSSYYSKEDKITAARSLAGLAGEMAMFYAVSSMIRSLIWGMTSSALGYEESDEDKKKRMEYEVKGIATNFVRDAVSPLPMLDAPVMVGANKVLNLIQGEQEDKEQNFQLYEGVDKGVWDDWGVLGIAFSKAGDMLEKGNTAITGEYENKWGTKYELTKDGQSNMQLSAVLSILYNIGALPSEFGTVSNYIERIVKKKESNKKKKKK